MCQIDTNDAAEPMDTENGDRTEVAPAKEEEKEEEEKNGDEEEATTGKGRKVVRDIGRISKFPLVKKSPFQNFLKLPKWPKTV